ncbi:hypothetical protein [Actinophytocola sp.]|uniref:hypothetical protein n=1 Tax=Actinophytocola sp. TaxID=1872138 RepID=UPI00389A9BE8
MSDEDSGRTNRRKFIRTAGAVGAGAAVALTTGTAAAAETRSDVGTNSFDNAGGGVILNPGGATTWSFGWGDDRHVQIGAPNILAPQNGAVHTYFNFGKSLSGSAATYFVTIRNDGGVQAVHNLEGGGLT